jgi:hypothetical protein
MAEYRHRRARGVFQVDLALAPVKQRVPHLGVALSSDIPIGFPFSETIGCAAQCTDLLKNAPRIFQEQPASRNSRPLALSLTPCGS